MFLKSEKTWMNASSQMSFNSSAAFLYISITSSSLDASRNRLFHNVSSSGHLVLITSCNGYAVGMVPAGALTVVKVFMVSHRIAMRAARFSSVNHLSYHSENPGS